MSDVKLLKFHAGRAVMESASRTPKVLHFSDYVLNLRTAELSRNGDKITLQDQPFQILIALLESPGQLVTREELISKLWPAGTNVDFDQSLNKAIARLREALDDNPEHPRFVETLPRRGYRFVAPVDGYQESTSSGVLDTSSSPSQHNWLLFRMIAASVLIAVVLFLPFVFRTKRDQQSVEIAPIPTRPGWARHPSFSPDGSEITFDYAGESSDSPDIYVQVLGDEKMLRLTTPPGASFCPSWSPDGQRIAYVHYAEADSGGPERTIMLMTPLGGSMRIIRPLAPENGSCRVSWSPDGKLLAFADKPTGESIGVFVTSANGSYVRRVTTAPDKMLDGSPSFSPDGQKIAFVRISTMFTGEIYIVPISGGEATRLTFLNEDVGDPVWTSDGRRILFTVKGPATGGAILYSLPSRGGTPERLLLPDSSISSPAISPRGDKLAYEKVVFSMAIWKLSIADSAAPIAKFIASTRTDSDPSFSPDGTKIAFDSTRDGTEAMWLYDVDGANPTKLAVVHQGGSPSWAPDGVHIAFDDRHTGRSHIYLLNVHRGDPQRLTEGDFDDEVPSWSVDGESIYFASNRTGTYQVWKMSNSTKAVVQITHNGGLFPSESPDGRFVYYNKPAIPYIDDETRGLWRMPVAGGREELIIRDADRLWAVRPKGIYFIDNTRKTDSVLKLFAPQTRTTKVVGHLGKDVTSHGGHNLEISPDGHSALYVRVETWNGELVLAKRGSW